MNNYPAGVSDADFDLDDRDSDNEMDSDGHLPRCSCCGGDVSYWVDDRARSDRECHSCVGIADAAFEDDYYAIWED